jgi:hypothetical protein
VTRDEAAREAPRTKGALSQRLRNLARAESLPEVRLQRHLGVLVVAELLGRVRSENGQQLFLVKGGSSIEMRLGISVTRTSKDLDAVFRGDFEQMYQLARASLESGWNDFTAVVTPPEVINVPGLPTKPRRFDVKVSFRGTPWCTVPVEVSPAEASSADAADFVSPSPFAELHLGTLGLDEAALVPCLPLPYQLAQKLHACTAPRPAERANVRAHDLIDILLLWPLVPAAEHGQVRAACVEIFESRATHRWPPSVSAPQNWAALYSKELKSMVDVGGLPTSVEAAVAAVQVVVSTIDAAVPPSDHGVRHGAGGADSGGTRGR